MPRDIHFEAEDKTLSVATEDELLEFVNKMRAAGGADILEALLPSVPQNPNACLIAVGCNFSSKVIPLNENYDLKFEGDSLGDQKWVLEFPENMSFYNARNVVNAVDCELLEGYDFQLLVNEELGAHLRNYGSQAALDCYYMLRGLKVDTMGFVLPREIGNAAHAFDEHEAFTDFIKNEEA